LAIVTSVIGHASIFSGDAVQQCLDRRHESGDRVITASTAASFGLCWHVRAHNFDVDDWVDVTFSLFAR
jgi:hypothetical protein